MAKNKSKTTDQITEENEAATSAISVETSTSKSSVKDLFGAYDAADAALNQLKVDAEVAGTARSNAVKAILDETKSKGPFKYKGQIVTIVSRTTKNAAGDEVVTHFFKGQRQGVVEID